MIRDRWLSKNWNKLNSKSFIAHLDSEGNVSEYSYYFMNHDAFNRLDRDGMIRERIRQGFCRNTIEVRFDGQKCSFYNLTNDQIIQLKEEILRSPKKEIHAIGTGNKLYVLKVGEDQKSFLINYYSLRD